MRITPGMTAMVTGASGGLGEAFARQLAARGVNLILIARSKERLDAIASELRAKNVQVEVLFADLSNAVDVQRITGVFAMRAIDLLINNAGVGGSGVFEAMPIERVRDQLSLNIDALVELSHAAISTMLERKSGAILNVASTAAFQPVPYMSVYAATKAFVLSFSEALAEEVRGRGVQVLAFCPGPVETNFAKAADMTESPMFKNAAKPDDVARTGLAALEAGRTTKISSLGQALLTQTVRFTPRRLVTRIAGLMVRPKH